MAKCADLAAKKIAFRPPTLDFPPPKR